MLGVEEAGHNAPAHCRRAGPERATGKGDIGAEQGDRDQTAQGDDRESVAARIIGNLRGGRDDGDGHGRDHDQRDSNTLAAVDA
jgi:hypothetical protein